MRVTSHIRQPHQTRRHDSLAVLLTRTPTVLPVLLLIISHSSVLLYVVVGLADAVKSLGDCKGVLENNRYSDPATSIPSIAPKITPSYFITYFHFSTHILIWFLLSLPSTTLSWVDMKNVKVELRIPAKEMESIENLVKEGIYRNTGEVIRQAVRDFLKTPPRSPVC